MHARPRGSDKTSKHADTSANQKPEEKWKWHIRGKSYALSDNKIEFFLNIKLIKCMEMPPDAFCPQCGGRAGVFLSGHM